MKTVINLDRVRVFNKGIEDCDYEVATDDAKAAIDALDEATMVVAGKIQSCADCDDFAESLKVAFINGSGAIYFILTVVDSEGRRCHLIG